MKKFLTYVCLAVFLFAGVYASVTMAAMPRTYDGSQAAASVYELQQDPQAYDYGNLDGAAAAIAALDTGEEFAAVFAAMDDEYMNARSADIRDMSHRIYDILCGNTGFQLPEGSFLLVAEDLAPSETIQLPRERIMAFITRQGSSSSHTAILARTLNIPSLVQSDIALETADECQILAVDGFTGTWYADPDEETLAMLRAKQAEAAAARNALEQYRGKESVTRSGKKVLLVANIGCPEDAVDALKADAEGVGLMRSEFLYLGRNSLPTEDELFEAYKQVAETMAHRPVVIRTLDIGADKQVSYLGLEAEENPALGLRGLRICLTNEEIFRPQLRAIYRASAYGNLHMMFPMVASVWELKAAKALCAKIRMELEAEGYPTKDVPIGVMVETPAAAVLAHELAKEAAAEGEVPAGCVIVRGDKIVEGNFHDSVTTEKHTESKEHYKTGNTYFC